MAVRGGNKILRIIRNAKRGGGIRRVQIGFFSTAKYEDGTPVSNVAATNEFGSQQDGIPERPFIRQALPSAHIKVQSFLKRRVPITSLIITRTTGELAGQIVKGEIQSSITRLSSPPNSPATIIKKGSSNPLVDTGFMKNSVAVKVFTV